MGDYEVIRDFLNDRRFVDLRRRADRGILLWSDLTPADIPDGYTKEQIWDILNIVRRQTAVELPWDTFTEKGYAGKGWYANTRALTAALAGIDTRIGAGSDLSRKVEEHRGSNPLMGRVFDDIAHAFDLSGYPVSTERIRNAFKGSFTAGDKVDRLLANFVSQYFDLSDIAKQRISPWTIEHLYQQLVHGVEGFTPEGRELPVKRYSESVYADPDVTLKTISQIVEGQAGEDTYHPVLRILHAAWFFWVNRPFPAWNALVELLVRYACLMRCGYPAFVYVPLARLQDDWMHGKIEGARSPDELFDHYAEYMDDYTPFHLLMLGIITADLDDLEALVNDLVDKDGELERSLENAYFNSRQRAILANALNNPDVPQKIEPHRRSYRVSYATARKDFLDLEERGYLKRVEEGRAFAFLPTSELMDVYAH